MYWVNMHKIDQIDPRLPISQIVLLHTNAPWWYRRYIKPVVAGSINV